MQKEARLHGRVFAALVPVVGPRLFPPVNPASGKTVPSSVVPLGAGNKIPHPWVGGFIHPGAGSGFGTDRGLGAFQQLGYCVHQFLNVEGLDQDRHIPQPFLHPGGDIRVAGHIQDAAA